MCCPQTTRVTTTLCLLRPHNLVLSDVLPKPHNEALDAYQEERRIELYRARSLNGKHSSFEMGHTSTYMYRSTSTFPQSFLKTVCAYNFFCATFYLNSPEFGMTGMKYVQKAFWREHLCALQVIYLSFITRLNKTNLARKRVTEISKNNVCHKFVTQISAPV